MCDSRGWTALHCASVDFNPKFQNLELLLEDGRAYVNAKVVSSPVDWDSTSVICIRAIPLHLAVINKHLEGGGAVVAGLKD